MTAQQLPLLPPPTGMSLARATAEIDWLWGKGPHPDDVPARDLTADARAVAERHRASVNALSGRR